MEYLKRMLSAMGKALGIIQAEEAKNYSALSAVYPEAKNEHLDSLMQGIQASLASASVVSNLEHIAESARLEQNYQYEICCAAILSNHNPSNADYAKMLVESYKNLDDSKLMAFCRVALELAPTNKQIRTSVYEICKRFYGNKEYAVLVDGVYPAIQSKKTLEPRLVSMVANAQFNLGKYEDAYNSAMYLSENARADQIPLNLFHKTHLKLGTLRSLHLFLIQMYKKHSYEPFYGWVFNVMRLMNRGAFVDRYLDWLVKGLDKKRHSAQFVLNVLFMAEEYDRIHLLLDSKHGASLSDESKESVLLKIAYQEKDYLQAASYLNSVGQDRAQKILNVRQINEVRSISGFITKWSDYVGEDAKILKRPSIGEIIYLVLNKMGELECNSVKGQVLQTNTTLEMGGIEQQLLASSKFLRDPRSPSGKMPKVCIYLKAHTPGNKAPEGIQVVTGADVDLGQIDQLPAQSAAFLREVLSLKSTALSGDIVKAILFLLKLRPEVIHVRSPSTKIPFSVAAAVLNIPKLIIHTGNIHPSNRPNYSSGKKASWKLDDNLLQFIAKHYAGFKVSSVSEPARKSWAENLGIPFTSTVRICDCIDIQRLGVPESADGSLLRRKYNIPKDAFVVGTVSRIDKVKDPQLWLRIAAQFSKKVPDAHFVMVGDGPMFDHIEHLVAQHGLTGKVHLTGLVRDNLAGYLGMMDAFLITSYTEGLCNAAFEATYFNKPVIAPKVGGLVESVMDNKTGWLLNRDQPEEFVQKLIDMYEKKPGHQLPLASARQEIIERFSVEQMVKETLVAYGWSE